MNSDEIVSILAEAKRLAKRYRELTGRPLGITGEIAEYEATRLLDLELAPVREAGYDAVRVVGERRERLQIKSRCLLPGAKPGQRLGSIDLTKPWDAVLLVLLDDHFEATAIYEADRQSIEAALLAPGSKSRNERGALGVSKFKSIARRIWPDVASAVPASPRLATSGSCVCCAEGVQLDAPRSCPRCGHSFRGKGWEGIDAHWRAYHEHEMPYAVFWDTLCSQHKEWSAGAGGITSG